MEELAKILANYGFPVAVAAFLLIRMEKRMEGLEQAINALSTKVEELNIRLENKRRK